MIIIEGPDLTGKTTLANELQAQFNSRGIHLGLPPPGMRHWDVLVRELALVNRNTVYDRACLGSIVYGKIMSDEPNRYPVTEAELGRFVEYMVLTHSLVIMTHASDDAIRARYRKRGDNYLNVKQILAASKGYIELAATFDRRLQTLLYNSEDYSAQEFIEGNFSRIHAALLPATGYVTDYRAHKILGYRRGS